MRSSLRVTLTAALALVVAPTLASAAGLNVLLKQKPTSTILKDLGRFGTVRDVIPEIKGVTMLAPTRQIPLIRARPYVLSVSTDQVRNGKPVDTVPVSEFSGGYGTWDLDAIDVTISPLSATRTVTQDGSGVYVAVLDSGLLDTWKQYFPQQRIATSLARAFGGGGGNVGTVSSQPDKWAHDTVSHGTHVTSTIIGYSFFGTYFNGVAPKATIIPVKVLNQNGSGWSSVIARGIVYVADLKADGVLGSAPVVINMSLGGSRLDPLEEAAIDYAIGEGVIVVASAGNGGPDGNMGYPGGYSPVISSAAVGWVDQWFNYPASTNWWYNRNVVDPTNEEHFFVSDFSAQEGTGQDLDIGAPGDWVLGPYQTQNGQPSYYFVSGTSMAAPHVTGVVALMLQKNPNLTAAQVEGILESVGPVLDCGDSATVGSLVPPYTATATWTCAQTPVRMLDADAAIAATP